MSDFYIWIKALHVIAVISWLAGLLYLPRLYVYHVNATPEQAKMLEVMERKLLRYIMNPAMILTFIFGIILVFWYIDNGAFKTAGWLHAKIALVFCLAGVHGFLSAARKRFADGKNTHSEKFYRMLNEVPTLLMILIIILVIVKPF